MRSSALLRTIKSYIFSQEQLIEKQITQVFYLSQQVPALVHKITKPIQKDRVYNVIFCIIHATKNQSLKDAAFACAKALIDLNVDPNMHDFEFTTVLHLLAPYKEHIQLMRFFLENGADPRKRNAYSDTAVDIAQKARNFEGVALLLEWVKKLNSEDEFVMLEQSENGGIKSDVILLAHQDKR